MEKTQAHWLLTNISRLVTCDGTMRCLAPGAVAIAGDTLVAVGSPEEVESRYIGQTTLDLSGVLVMPGLVNTHTHAAMSCFRGISDDLPLSSWLHDVIFPAEAAFVNAESVYWGTLLSIVEMLKNGITTFCDGYFFEESAARAALDGGIRAVMGQGVLDFPTPDQVRPAAARDRAESFLRSFPFDPDGRLRPSLFCHAPYTCGPKTLQWVKSMCRDAGILFQIHLSETAGEVEEITRQHGMRPVHYLDHLGILDSDTLCAHCVWVDRGEIEVLASRRASVSGNVESNMKLGAGVAPVSELLDAGPRVGLGTDGCAGNNDLDLFSEMDRLAKLQKVFRRDPTVCPAPRVLRMGTMGGAQALNMGHEVGSLEPGKKADLIAIDLDQPHLTPLYDPVSHLVYAAQGSDVRHVWVNGRRVVENGRVQTVDEKEAMKQVARIAARVQSTRHRASSPRA